MSLAQTLTCFSGFLSPFAAEATAGCNKATAMAEQWNRSSLTGDARKVGLPGEIAKRRRLITPAHHYLLVLTRRSAGYAAEAAAKMALVGKAKSIGYIPNFDALVQQRPCVKNA